MSRCFSPLSRVVGRAVALLPSQGRAGSEMFVMHVALPSTGTTEQENALLWTLLTLLACGCTREVLVF